MEKNTNAINKIIAELSLSDYKSQWNRLTDKQRYNVRIGKKKFSYSLSIKTLEAIEIKNSYINGTISEADYKTWCLSYNLRTA